MSISLFPPEQHRRVVCHFIVNRDILIFFHNLIFICMAHTYYVHVVLRNPKGPHITCFLLYFIENDGSQQNHFKAMVSLSGAICSAHIHITKYQGFVTT
jgi:hypothetical protein